MKLITRAAYPDVRHYTFNSRDKYDTCVETGNGVSSRMIDRRSEKSQSDIGSVRSVDVDQIVQPLSPMVQSHDFLVICRTMAILEEIREINFSKSKCTSHYKSIISTFIVKYQLIACNKTYIKLSR